jgi:hypothetical protein
MQVIGVPSKIIVVESGISTNGVATGAIRFKIANI